jgi:hypothetical protein
VISTSAAAGATTGAMDAAGTTIFGSAALVTTAGALAGRGAEAGGSLFPSTITPRPAAATAATAPITSTVRLVPAVFTSEVAPWKVLAASPPPTTVLASARAPASAGVSARSETTWRPSRNGAASAAPRLDTE